MTKIHGNQPMDIDSDMADAQHKKMHEFRQQANQLLVNDGSNATEEFHTLLNDFAVFAREYFATKEEKLRQTNPDRLEKHVAEHIMQESQLTDILLSASIGILDKTRLQRLLSEWWTHHEQAHEELTEEEIAHHNKERMA